MKDLLIKAARGKKTDRPPVWLMRQAGRYLPRYREIREKYSFKEAIKNPEIAEEISLLPWNKFKVDGVVIYSDILITLESVGFNYEIGDQGPIIDNPIKKPSDINLKKPSIEDELWYVGETIQRVSKSIQDEAGVIGFAGGPYTLASYAIENKDKIGTRAFMIKHPSSFKELLEKLSKTVADVLKFQQNSGADIIQLFDTWAGFLSPDDYKEFILPTYKQILKQIDIPTIIFTRNSGGKLSMLKETGADVVSIDWTVDISKAKNELGEKSIQGNLDPAYLLGNEKTVKQKTRKILEHLDSKGHILNLGHGVPKNAKPENVKAFVEEAKNYNRNLKN